jgi:phage major head subunit gpT-like protein
VSQKITFGGEATLIEAPILADGQSGGNPKFSLVGYTGRAIRQAWSRTPLVVDLAGMDTTSQPIAVMLGHQYDIDHAVGQASDVVNSGTDLTVATEVIGESPEVAKAVTLARKGWRFQASIGADVGRIENIAAGESVEVNGRQFAGPISVVRASTLREVSIVLFGADAATSAAIAAEANDGGFPMADHATQKPDEVKASAEATAKVAVEAKAPEAVTPPAPSVDLGAIKAELLEQLRKEVKAEALADIRADRPSAPAVHVVAKPAETDELLVASICLAGNLPGVDKQFGERTLEAAHKRRNMGLQEMLLRAAKANGYQGDAYKLTDGNLRDVLRASFGSSTHSIANVVGTAYGKFLLNGYTSVESVWDRISMIRPVSDFKAVTGVRVNGGFTFEEVGPAGELKSAEATDEARSFGAKSYGRISAISRRDIINDDLGALTVVPTRLGRGAALRFNTNFWTEFQASNATYFERATAGAGNALNLTSLKAAVSAYRKVTDADGNPLSVAPAMLLLPPELEIAGAELMGSALIHGTSGAAPSTNVLAGRYQVVSSVYLSSASTWWLVANPGDLNAMEVLFLNGNRNPVVEQAEADFDTLGIQVRGYFDFGVAKGEPKSCYRMATA